MAKGNSKAAEKKRDRMQRKMDACGSIVKTANLQNDPLESLPSFKVSNQQTNNTAGCRNGVVPLFVH